MIKVQFLSFKAEKSDFFCISKEIEVKYASI